MNIGPVNVVLATILFIADHTIVLADGLIHRLPKDTSWVQFDLTGERLSADGKVTETTTGTVKVKSVGQERVDGNDCRWIEIETEMEHRGTNGLRSRGMNDFKLLIPTQYLATGQNPLAHAIKGWKKDVRGFVTELDLKDNDSRGKRMVVDWLTGSPANLEKSEAKELKVPGGTFQCTRLTGKESPESGGVDLEIQTWVTDQLPFGVAAYRHTKTRKKEGETPNTRFEPLGSRWVELKFAKSGDDAKSEVVPEAK